MAKKKLTARQAQEKEKENNNEGWTINQTCPLCHESMDEPINGVSVKHWQDTIARIREEHPEWSAEDGACVRCLVYYGMARAGRAGEET